MDTRDLTSYYPGYEDRDNDAKVPFGDYRELEDKIEIYEKGISRIEDILDSDEYAHLEKVKETKRILKEMKEELWRFLIILN